jgi:HPt (histidine-containing phosphotransfer) domain-containing protein
MGGYEARFDLLKNSGFDPRALWDRVDGDAELLRELVDIFVDESPGLLQSIGAGIQQGAFDDVRKFSHKLKGSALQFSGTGAAALAESLERMGRDQSLQGADQVFARLEKEIADLIQSLQSITSGKGGSPAD